jgi:hypothetical protein
MDTNNELSGINADGCLIPKHMGIDIDITSTGATAMWTQAEAIELCSRVEQHSPAFGYHVALTGGCLYKDGRRKDADILFYRIRQEITTRVDDMFAALNHQLGIKIVQGGGWVYKAEWRGKSIDFLFPESGHGGSTVGYKVPEGSSGGQ